MGNSKSKKERKEEKKMQKPWRSFEEGGDWSIQYEQRLKEELKGYNAHKELMRANILFIGYVASGKSSFINSIASIDKGRIASPLIAGQTDTSMSFKLKMFLPDTNLQNFVLYDTMGVEKANNAGFNVQDIVYLIHGHIKPDYRFNPKIPITETDKHFIKSPSLEDKVHCVAFVVSSDLILSRTTDTEMGEKIKILLLHLREYEIPTVVVLTRIDVISEDIAEDVKITYLSKTAKDAFEEACRVFKVPRMHIFPVKNYSDETSLDPYKNILLLLALRKMLQLSSDHLTTTFTHSSGKRFTKEVGSTSARAGPLVFEALQKKSYVKISGDTKFQASGKRFTIGEVGGRSACARPLGFEGANSSNSVKVLTVVPHLDLDLATKSFFSTLQKKLIEYNVELERVKDVQEVNTAANTGRVVFLICGGHLLVTDSFSIIKEVNDHKRLVLVNFYCVEVENNIIRASENVLKQYKDIADVIVMTFDRDSEETGIYDCDLNRKAVKNILKRVRIAN